MNGFNGLTIGLICQPLSNRIYTARDALGDQYQAFSRIQMLSLTVFTDPHVCTNLGSEQSMDFPNLQTAGFFFLAM